MDFSQHSHVNLQDGVWVAVRPTPGWRTRALRAARTPARDRRSLPQQDSYSKFTAALKLPLDVPQRSVLWEWEYGWMSPWRRHALQAWSVARRPLKVMVLLVIAFILGWNIAAGPKRMLEMVRLRDQAARTNNALRARTGELELARQEMARMGVVMQNSKKYSIPADLAAEIYDIARAEGIDPSVAFELVSVESDFTHKAVSKAGAVGLAQVMPSTAYEMDPRLRYNDLFDRKTNLRLGFRYLRDLIRQYNGNLRFALLAYNRGPVVVDRIRRAGGDPENGYSNAVLGKSRTE